MSGAASMTGIIDATNPGGKKTSLPFSDSFIRANGPAGQPWYNPLCVDPSLEIVGDTLQAPATGPQAILALLLDTGNVDATFTVAYPADDGNRQDLQFHFRRGACLRANEYYLVSSEPHSTDVVSLYQSIGGVFTQLAGSSTVPIRTGNIYTYRVQVIGGRVIVSVNGIRVLSWAIDPLSGQDTVLLSSVHAGVAISNLNITTPSGAYYVQQVAAGSANPASVTTFTVPVSASTAGGDTLILGLRVGGGILPTAITDSKGNTWHIDVHSATTACTATLARCHLTNALTSGDTITVTMSAAISGQFVGWQCLEYAGIPAAAILDVTQSNRNTGPDRSGGCGPSTAVAHAQEIAFTVVALANTQGSAPQVSPGSWLAEGSPSFSSNFSVVAIADRYPNSGDTLSETWTWSTGTAWAIATGSYTTV